MTKILAPWLLVVALCLGLWWALTSKAAVVAENAQLSQAVQQAAEDRKADAKALASLRAQKSRQRAADALAGAALQAAIRSESAWADQPVPESVLKAINDDQ